MIILFPRRKGIKIATTLIFKEIEGGAGTSFILGMIHFAFSFGAITRAEQQALIEYLEERES